jgi:hypothetical protein
MKAERIKFCFRCKRPTPERRQFIGHKYCPECFEDVTSFAEQFNTQKLMKVTDKLWLMVCENDKQGVSFFVNGKHLASVDAKGKELRT